MNRIYIHRTIEKELLNAVKDFPIVTLTGPRQTGKTTLLRNLFPNYSYVTLDDPTERKTALDDPNLFLRSHKGNLIIDEIQYVPELLPVIKIIVDEDRSINGRYLLTGSQFFPLMAGLTESLAGRTALFQLLGFSFNELPTTNLSGITREECWKYMLNGFYPDPLLHRVDRVNFYQSYLHTYLERDIRQISSVHDLRIFQEFLELLASRAGCLLNLNEIAKECGISFTTAKRWISILESSNIVYLLRPYHRNVSKRVIKCPKIYFTDTGLLSYILRYPNEHVLAKGPHSGAFFENMIVAEILKFKYNTNALFELYFYRDSHHNEIDIVLDYGYKVVALELKATETVRNEHIKTMSKIKETIDYEHGYLLSFCNSVYKMTDKIDANPWYNLYSIII